MLYNNKEITQIINQLIMKIMIIKKHKEIIKLRDWIKQIN
jgi:hypothetical protein